MSARTFTLVRAVDVTGISGLGAVAEGVEFSDGTVALRWLAPYIAATHRERGVRPTTVLHESIESVEALHGHNGATQVVWDADAPTRPAPALEVSADAPTERDATSDEAHDIGWTKGHIAGYREGLALAARAWDEGAQWRHTTPDASSGRQCAS